MMESNAQSQTRIAECASFVMTSVVGVTALQLDYNVAGTLPATTGSEYRISECPAQGLTSILNPPFRSTLTGAGSISILNCGEIADVVLDGDRSALIVGSDVGDLTVNGTTSAKLLGCGRGVLTHAVGATLEEALQRGTVAFAAEATKAVTLPAPHPDTNYTVAVELGSSPSGETPWVTLKTTTGFTLNFDTPQTITGTWTVARTL